ncbi:MAG: exodeoxyribonuclease VII large subunit [Phycisphaerales bacterium]|nr:exodeoxyribonuclease VII large subunit [Phycisphaerales bacterium]
MGQLPLTWKPGDAPPGDRPKPPPDEPLSVSELSASIVEALETLPSTVRVRGEVSNLSTRRHWYFSLKDEHALIGCVMWSSRTRGVEDPPAEGDEVEVSGHIAHYAPQGRTQLIVERIRQAGAGALRARYEALCAELREAGWFDPEHKQPLPLLPVRIAVVTSGTSAALTDVVRTARERCPGTALLVVDVRVQGEEAVGEVVEAIGRLDAHRTALGLDAILVTRGGGSPEDLQAFNERAVAQAVRECTLPVVAAIGHESDTTIIELVADRRASTPTQAVMHLLPDAGELRQQVDDRTQRLRLLAGQLVQHATQRSRQQVEQLRRTMSMILQVRRTTVQRLATALAHRRPDVLLQQRRARVQAAAQRLEASMQRRLQAGRVRLQRGAEALPRTIAASQARRHEQVETLQRTLQALGPVSVLERGFSMTTDEAGDVVRSTEGIEPGVRLTTHLVDGRIETRVEQVESSGTVEP